MLEERLNLNENEDYKVRNESEINEEKIKTNKEKIKTYHTNQETESYERSQQEIYYSNLNKQMKERKLMKETLIIMFFGWLSGILTALSVL